MRQKRFPCCKEPMVDADIFSAIEDGSSSCPIIQCPYCQKTLTVYLNIESVELNDEESEEGKD